jgi:hypothetical protein
MTTDERRYFSFYYNYNELGWIGDAAVAAVYRQGLIPLDGPYLAPSFEWAMLELLKTKPKALSPELFSLER